MIHSALLLIPHFEVEGKCFKKLKVLLVLISFEIEMKNILIELYINVLIVSNKLEKSHIFSKVASHHLIALSDL